MTMTVMAVAVAVVAVAIVIVAATTLAIVSMAVVLFSGGASRLAAMAVATLTVVVAVAASWGRSWGWAMTVAAFAMVVGMAFAAPMVVMVSMVIMRRLQNQALLKLCAALGLVIIRNPVFIAWVPFHGFLLDVDIQLIPTSFPPIDFHRLPVFAKGPMGILWILVAYKAILAITLELNRGASLFVRESPLRASTVSEEQFLDRT